MDLIGNSVYINANNSEHVLCLTLAYVFWRYPKKKNHLTVNNANVFSIPGLNVIWLQEKDEKLLL